MLNTNRRNFLRLGAGAAAATMLPEVKAAKRSATDWVTLGKSGVKVTRLAFGTGTNGGRVQRNLGQKEFTRLVRHAYERGIRFFESADNYDQMHEMLAEALRGIPRESYRLMTKLRWQNAANEGYNPMADIDRFRRELNSDYFDILLLHNVKTVTWPKDLERLRDAFSEAKHKQIIRCHGCSGHGLMPIRAYSGNPWLDVALMRVNHDGTRMDNLKDEANAPGVREEVYPTIERVHGQGTGVLGMKIMGEGRFITPEQRDASVKFVMKFGKVDAVTIGFKTTAEIDEAIERINTHLNS
ncbi:MAG: aldo/keto reductase [Acidobacteriota bacterium]|jgi:aryl-alcohol dehydrogenase-like predicted oxidoreductase